MYHFPTWQHCIHLKTLPSLPGLYELELFQVWKGKGLNFKPLKKKMRAVPTWVDKVHDRDRNEQVFDKGIRNFNSFKMLYLYFSAFTTFASVPMELN